MSASKLEVIAHPDKPTIITRRWLDAPRELVYEAFTRPEHLKRWLGPRRHVMVVCEIDLRVGGAYRWVFQGDGQEYGFHGVYKEIVRPEKLVSTFIFDPFPDAEALDTVTFEERDGRTLATTLTLHKSIQARDGQLGAGMADGMSEGYARLDELLAEQRAQGV